MILNKNIRSLYEHSEIAEQKTYTYQVTFHKENKIIQKNNYSSKLRNFR